MDRDGLNDVEMRLSALMRRSLAGDQPAYRELLGALTSHTRLYFTRRLGRDAAADAEDLVQDTLMAIHTRRATYDTSRPVTAWIHAIARYKLIDHLRRQRGHAAVSIDDADALFSPDEHEAAAARMDVDRMLETLPERQRGLVRHVRLEGGSIAEAAARGGVSETAAKVSIHRALKQLATRFGKGGRDVDE